jgi:PAS domain S-box-containing protein
MSDVATITRPVSSLRGDEISARSLKVLEATTDVVAMTDRSGVLVYLNANGRRLLGFGENEPLGGRSLADLQPAWAYEVVSHDAFPTALSEGSWSGETALLSANGTELPVLQVLLSHQTPRGEVEFLSTICRDITDRKQRELERIEWANRYDAAIRASGQVVFDWDPQNGTITYGGDVDRLLGFTAEEMGGGIDRLRKLIHPHDLARFDAEIERTTAAREALHFEFRAIRADKVEITIEVQGCFFLDRQGRFGRMVGFLKDISAERAAELSIQQANEILEQRVAQRTHELQRANRELLESARRQEAVARLGQRALTGLPLDELMRETANIVHDMMPVDCTSLLKYDESQNVLHLLAEAGWPFSGLPKGIPAGQNSQSGYTMKVGEPVIAPDLETETRFHPSESVRQAGARSGLSVCIKSDNRTFGVLCAFSLTHRDFSPQDVSFLQTIANVVTAAIERTESEEKVRQAKSDAEAANRAKSEFLSRMSHELRTPLNAILGFTQLLEMEEHTERQTESILHISRAGRNLLDLINEVLDIARLDAGRVQFNMETVNVVELLREALRATTPAADKRKIQFRIAEPIGEDPFVSADRDRLKQVLINLLSNGVKFNQEGGSVTVAVARMDERHWRISVTDTGVGIPQDKLSRLFVPFERLGTREGGTAGGTGLGLALCQRLVKGFGGRIGVASTVGLGSTFWIEFPSVEVGPKPVREPAPAKEPVAQPAPADAVRTVLYIEDDVTNFYLLKRILASRKDIKLVSAVLGRSGVDLALEHRPGLILLDMNLPDMTGEQVLRALKADPLTADIRVVAVTGEVLGPREKELRALGVIDALLKPYKVADLTAILDRTFKAAN